MSLQGHSLVQLLILRAPLVKHRHMIYLSSKLVESAFSLPSPWVSLWLHVQMHINRPPHRWFPLLVLAKLQISWSLQELAWNSRSLQYQFSDPLLDQDLTQPFGYSRTWLSNLLSCSLARPTRCLLVAAHADMHTHTTHKCSSFSRWWHHRCMSL